MNLEGNHEINYSAHRYHANETDEFGKEGVFLEEDPKKLEPMVQAYERLLSNPEFFVGLGNNALVFSTTAGRSLWCIKNRWDTVSVECRSKNYKKFPLTHQKLRNVQDYFQEVKEKKRAFINRGVQFMPQCTPFQEAIYSNRSRKIVVEAGLEKMIPKVSHVCKLERNIEGSFEDGDPYMVDESVYMILMEQVPGKNIEEMIMHPGQYKDILSKVDVKQIKETLIKALTALHEHGLYHNDISVRNILIDGEGKPHLIDFGAAQQFEAGNEEMFEENLKSLDNVINWFDRLLKDPEKTRVTYREEQGYID